MLRRIEMDAIIVKNLTKKFKEATVLDNVNITFEKRKSSRFNRAQRLGKNDADEMHLRDCAADFG